MGNFVKLVPQQPQAGDSVVSRLTYSAASSFEGLVKLKSWKNRDA